MPASLPCTFNDAKLAYVKSLPNDLDRLTRALDTLDGLAWSAWIVLAQDIAQWSAHVRDHHGCEVAFSAELMVLQAQAAPYVRGWEFSEVMRLYEPIEGFWRA